LPALPIHFPATCRLRWKSTITIWQSLMWSKEN